MTALWPRPAHRSHCYAGIDRPVLVWEPSRPVLAVASAVLGGGLGVRRWVLNAQVPKSYDCSDPGTHLAEIAATVGCHGPGIGLCTATSVNRVSRATDAGIVAAATVGLTWPTWAAAAPDPAAVAHPAGTVNIVAWVPVRLADAALVNAVMTATEAKTQALLDASVPGTGTASDAVCICCPVGGPAALYAGPRSEWGARLARAVHTAVARRTGSGGPR